jgi:hypothetical protein
MWSRRCFSTESMEDAMSEETTKPKPGDAGHDTSISDRLEKDPKDKDAKLDEALDESMDASDPPGITPKGGKDPVPSSGYDEEQERQRAN